MSSWDSFPPASGTTLDGRFVVERELGRGGMSVVLSAQHLGLHRRVAIKLLRPEFVSSPDFVGRFLRESRAVARLQSEHVVDVLDVGTLSTGLPYYVMEHLSGIDLGELVQKRGPLEIDDVVEYTLQALEALAEAHRRGIVHRDLKPANLFLTTREDDSGFVKVLDFGVSKLVGWEVTVDGMVTRQGMVLGSPHYMSPEHIRDASAVDARSDLWSLGATMHELLTGRPPFDAQPLPLVIRTIVTRPYILPDRDDLPLELAAILLRCMRKDRDSRFQSAAQLARAFQPLVRSATAQVSIDRILRRPSTTAPPRLDTGDQERAMLPSITPVESDTRPARRPFGVPELLISGGLFGVLALGGAWLLGRHVEERPPVVAPAAGARAEPPHDPKPPAVVVTEPKPVTSVQAVPAKRSSARSRKANPPTVTPTTAGPLPPTAPHVAKGASSLEVVAFPAPVPRRLRQLDTENPFRK